jgi:hypothetical protein
VIGIIINVRRATLEQNFDVTIGRAACEASSGNVEFGCQLGHLLWDRGISWKILIELGSQKLIYILSRIWGVTIDGIWVGERIY